MARGRHRDPGDERLHGGAEPRPAAEGPVLRGVRWLAARVARARRGAAVRARPERGPAGAAPAPGPRGDAASRGRGRELRRGGRRLGSRGRRRGARARRGRPRRARGGGGRVLRRPHVFARPAPRAGDALPRRRPDGERGPAADRAAARALRWRHDGDQLGHVLPRAPGRPPPLARGARDPVGDGTRRRVRVARARSGRPPGRARPRGGQRRALPRRRRRPRPVERAHPPQFGRGRLLRHVSDGLRARRQARDARVGAPASGGRRRANKGRREGAEGRRPARPGVGDRRP